TAVGKAMGAAAVFAVLPPMLVLHGDADSVVSARNAASTAEVWAHATGATPAPARQVQRGKRLPMRITDYKSKGRTLVTLCEIGGLGHAWSGGTAALPFGEPTGPDASRLIWAFVSRQFGASATAAA
ncbi:MAG: phospholipase, partial [Gammaproteobacteria bacterium]|nr:phospholipase [Gammaproteobacteria bacterium]